MANQIQQEAQITAARYAFLVEELGMLISTHRPGDWAFTSANGSAFDILGYHPEEMIGVPAYFFFHPDDAEAMKQRTIPAVHAHGTRVFRYRHRHKDGHYVWLESTHRSIRDNDTGELKEIITISRDLSLQMEGERLERERQQALAQATRQITLGEMATGLAHEINQPLAAILNYSRGALRRLDADQLSSGELASILERMDRQAQRAAEIVKRLRSLVKKAPYQRSRFNINTTCREVRELLWQEWRTADIEVILDLQEPLKEVEADPVQIEQVLFNLLQNSIEAYSNIAGARVRRIGISTRQRGPSVLIRVEDFASGIAPKQREQLFEPYYSTKVDGLGMGLPICRSIAEAHSGSINVSSDGQSRTCFELTLPLPGKSSNSNA